MAGKRRTTALAIALLTATPIVCVNLASVAAQAPQPAVPIDASNVGSQLAAADELGRLGKWDDARDIVERALAFARAERSEVHEAQALIWLAETAYFRAQYPLAREHGLAGLAIAERLQNQAFIGRANHVLSTTAEFMGDIAESAARAERAVAAYDSANPRGRALATLQWVRVATLPPTEERRLMERAIDDARAAGDRTVEGTAVHMLGDGLFALGEYDTALATLNRAASLFEEAGAPLDLGTVYNSLGRVYRAHGQLSTALSFQLKALALHDNTSGFRHLQSLNAVAAVYGMLGETAKSREYTERALAMAEKTGSPRIQDFLRANLAGLLLESGEHARSAQLLEEVIAREKDGLLIRHATLSTAYRRLGKTDQAIAAADRIVGQCGKISDSDCVTGLERRAEAFLGKGDTSAALGDLRSALERIERSRAKLAASDFLKQNFAYQRERLYGLAIDLQIAHKQEREAVATAELARSRAFLDLLASRDVRIDARSPRYQSSASTPAAAAPDPADPLTQLALTLRGGSPPSTVPETADTLISDRSAPAATADDIVAIAKRLKSTILTYWVADEHVFVWVVTADGRLQTARVAVRQSHLRELVQATAPFASPATSPAVATAVVTRGSVEVAVGGQPPAWRQLYDLLIRPIRGALPGTPGALLTVIPHGPLTGLAFAALQDDRGRYLLEDFTLHYAPAGAMLQFTESRRRPDSRTGAVLVVADPIPPQRSTLDKPLPRLPGARAEAQSLRHLVPASRLTILSGGEATEARVAQAAERPAVLHFATHAIVHDDDPFRSFLALSRDQTTDGLLTLQEMYKLALQADMVVLSACRSASGLIVGDGIAAFARAFIYAGTPSVVASLWDVSDEPTNDLIATFYRRWLGGRSKAEALREAQLTTLAALRGGRVKVSTAAGEVTVPEHPLFWAGFALIGEPH